MFGKVTASAGAETVPAAPSGRQWELEGGGYRAVVVEVGGGLRTLHHGEHALLDGYDDDAIADGGRGQLLLPWPNRVADGRYRFAGRDHQLDLSEPALGHAIHGLVRWASWTPGDDAGPTAGRAHSQLTLTHRLQARPSYPFTLDYEVGYHLDEGGLTVRVTVTNAGSSDAPVAAGAHPYLTAGTATIDDCVLQVPAGEVLTTDARQIPQGRQPVEGSPLDFRVAHPIGDVVVDTAYTGLGRGDDGRARVTLSAPFGRSTELWVDDHHPYLMIFTGDTLAPARRRQGLAVEPMTAPPNRAGHRRRPRRPGAGRATERRLGIRDVTPD